MCVVNTVVLPQETVTEQGQSKESLGVVQKMRTLGVVENAQLDVSVSILFMVAHLQTL